MFPASIFTDSSDEPSARADGDDFMSDSDSDDDSAFFRSGDDDNGHAGEAKLSESKKRSKRTTEADECVCRR